MRSDNIMILIDRKISEIILQKMLSYEFDESKWSDEDWKVMNLMIFFVKFLSRLLGGSHYMNDFFSLHPQCSPFFFDLLSSSSMLSVD
jgi:hypothetical protein